MTCSMTACSSPCPAGADAGPRRLTRRTINRAVTHSDVRRDVNAMKPTSATWESETRRPSSASQTAFGYWIGVQESSPIAAIARLTAGSIRVVIANRAPALRAAAATAAL